MQKVILSLQKNPYHSENNDNNNVSQQSLNSNIRFPKIDLPTLSNRYDKWGSFYDTFNFFIHSDDSLSDIQKCLYLKAALSGNGLRCYGSR